MEISFYIVDRIIVRVKHQIDYLRQNIPEERIRVSIPHWFLNTIKETYQNQNYPEVNVESLFGVKIVEGYNNEIAVFDHLADPRSTFLEPIKIISTKTVNIFSLESM